MYENGKRFTGSGSGWPATPVAKFWPLVVPEEEKFCQLKATTVAFF
jgi:hypothetical protein